MTRPFCLGQRLLKQLSRPNRERISKSFTWPYTGFSDSRFPERSGVVLGVDSATSDDGILQVREIIHLRFNADLVTLFGMRYGWWESFREKRVDFLPYWQAVELRLERRCLILAFHNVSGKIDPSAHG